MSTVLWGARRGDVQYNSRAYWRRNIPIGAAHMAVASAVYFDVGDSIAMGDDKMRVVGLERDVLGVERVPA